MQIPPNSPITLEADLPTGTTDWPGPPAWSPSNPDMAIIELIEGTGQMQAKLITSADTMVNIECVTLTGSLDFQVDQAATAPTSPVQIQLA
jgi:hypothetical protein